MRGIVVRNGRWGRGLTGHVSRAASRRPPFSPLTEPSPGSLTSSAWYESIQLLLGIPAILRIKGSNAIRPSKIKKRQQRLKIAWLQPRLRTSRGTVKSRDSSNRAGSSSSRPAGRDNPGDILYFTRKLTDIQGQGSTEDTVIHADFPTDPLQEPETEVGAISSPDSAPSDSPEELAEGEEQPTLGHFR